MWWKKAGLMPFKNAFSLEHNLVNCHVYTQQLGHQILTYKYILGSSPDRSQKIRKVLIEFVSMVEQNGMSLIWAFFINNYYLVTTLKYFTITVLPKCKWALLE